MYSQTLKYLHWLIRLKISGIYVISHNISFLYEFSFSLATAQISQNTERLVSAFNQEQVTAFKGEFTEDCVLMVPNREPIFGRDGQYLYLRKLGRSELAVHMPVSKA